MSIKKNLKKVLVILLALMSVLLVAFSMSGCSAVDTGTYVNHAENAYIIVSEDDVQLYNICVDKYSTVNNVNVSVCLMTRTTYTYSTKYDKENEGYPIYVTVENTRYVAYYENKEEPCIKFKRAAFTASGEPEFIRFYKGEPNISYRPL